MTGTTKLELKIKGMHCGGCVTRLTHTLKHLKGVQVEGVQIGAAQLSYQPAVITSDEIQAAVRKAGWEPAVIGEQS